MPLERFEAQGERADRVDCRGIHLLLARKRCGDRGVEPAAMGGGARCARDVFELTRQVGRRGLFGAVQSYGSASVQFREELRPCRWTDDSVGRQTAVALEGSDRIHKGW